MNKYCYKYINNGVMKLVDGKYIGVKDKNNDPILLETLFSRRFNNFCGNMVGLNIPESELLKRTNYNWFCKLNKYEVINCDNILGNLFKTI